MSGLEVQKAAISRTEKVEGIVKMKGSLCLRSYPGSLGALHNLALGK